MSRRGPESAVGRGPTPHSTIIRRISETVTPKMLILRKTSLPELQSKWPQRGLLPRIFYVQFNVAETERQETVNSDEAELWHVNAVLHNRSKYQPSSSRIDELNLIRFPDEYEICKISTLEPTNAENLSRGYNQYLHVADISHPPI
ncbi:hypothetical protein ACTXT7_009963 [Hymenolepis weldensis]